MLAYKDYLNSFLFIINVVSIFSLLLDIGWIYNSFFKKRFIISKNNEVILLNSFFGDVEQFLTYVYIVRYLRMTRVFSWIRIFRETQKQTFANEMIENTDKKLSK